MSIGEAVPSVLHAAPILVQVHAELHLPRVADKESCTVTVSDADGLMWELKYRSVVLCRLLLRKAIIALSFPFWADKQQEASKQFGASQTFQCTCFSFILE
jgi:hypothetical protein